MYHGFSLKFIFSMYMSQKPTIILYNYTIQFIQIISENKFLLTQCFRLTFRILFWRSVSQSQSLIVMLSTF